MDPSDHPSIEVSTQKLLENVQKARTMGLVEGIREVTAGNRIDAEGERVTVDLVRDLMYEVMGRGAVQREDALLLLHPAQLYILREDFDLLERGDLAYEDGTTSFHGIPVLQDRTLPKATVYMVDPQAITVGGTVVYPRRVGRLTSLKHPDAYEK